MNRYIVSKAMKLMMRRWKLHLLFALQMAAGVATICACASIHHTAALQYRDLMAQIEGTVWDVTAAADRPTGRPPLDLDQYAKLKAAYPEASLPFCIAHPVHYTTDGNDIRTAWFLFASDDFLKTVLRADKSGFERGSAAYAGDEVRAVLDGRRTIVHRNIPIESDAGGELILADGARLSVLPMEELGTNLVRFTHQDLENVPLDRVALLPLASYYPHFKPEDAGRFKLSIKPGLQADGEEAPRSVMEMLGLLLEWNGKDYNYYVRTFQQRMLLSYEEIRGYASVAAAIAGLCLAIVLIGLTAVVGIMFRRRRRALAVCSALGAGRRSLLAELWLESSLPSLAGGITGAIACSWYLSAFVHTVTIRQSPAIMAAAAALSLLPGCLAAGTLALGIRRLKPLEMLRGDREWR